jgi:putative phosphoribosyl transferase
MRRTFADRLHAGRVLAGHLSGRSLLDPLVLALPRGGVCVAHPVAEVLGAPLEVLVARKLGAPSQPELAVGAIAEGGPRVVDEELLAALRVSAEVLAQIESAERVELERRVRRYRSGPLPALDGRDVVLVDDGLATGMTAQAALVALRARQPRSVLLAVPVGPPSTVREMAPLADELLCIEQPEPFGSVGRWYDEFPPVADREVVRLLADRADALSPGGARRHRSIPSGYWVPPRGRRVPDRRKGGQTLDR